MLWRPLFSLPLLTLSANALLWPSWPRSFAPSRRPSFFCFVVVRPNTYEVHTAKVQLDRGMLTACDAYAVYSNVSALPLLGSERMASPNIWSDCAAVKGSMDVAPDPHSRTTANAPVFRQVWQHIFKERIYLDYDWTIKVDPDTFFFPDRLRHVLRTHHASNISETRRGHDQSSRAIVLGNDGTDCLKVVGAIEAINKEAVTIMKERWHEVLDQSIPQEDAMLQVFAARTCKCREIEPRILSAACPSTKNVPCAEIVAMHGFKDAKDMEKRFIEMQTGTFQTSLCSAGTG